MDITDSQNSEATKIAYIMLWIVSVLIVGGASYLAGLNANKTNEKPTNVSGVASSTLPTQTEAAIISPVATIDLERSCEKSGPSQKKDYLVSYILKEGDNFQKIAETELQDATRVSELTTLNDDQRNLMIGSTIYLPPTFIKESSGRLAQVSGRLVKKDNASWQLTYGGGASGPGIGIPAFWLKDIEGLENVIIGDCLTILLDNGVKVYSVKKN